MKPWEADRERRMVERALYPVQRRRTAEEMRQEINAARWEAERVQNAERLAQEGR